VNKRKTTNLSVQINTRNLLLDLLLALDQLVVEVSMQLYKVDGRDRPRMRRQNRRLHAELRQHFPRVLKS
jgi:hypothetical protein